MLNKNILEKEIKEALREAYVKSFTDNIYSQEAVRYVKKAAKYFAAAAAPKIADAVDKYIKNADVVLSSAPIQNFTIVGTSPAGPVSGAATGPLAGEIKMGLK